MKNVHYQWLPIPPSASTYNVETEKQDPDSILNEYRKLLWLRKTEPALRDGSYEAVDRENPNVFSFIRRSGKDTVLVSLNMSAQTRTVGFPSLGTKATALYRSPSSESQVDLKNIELAPFGVFVAPGSSGFLSDPSINNRPLKPAFTSLKFCADRQVHNPPKDSSRSVNKSRVHQTGDNWLGCSHTARSLAVSGSVST